MFISLTLLCSYCMFCRCDGGIPAVSMSYHGDSLALVSDAWHDGHGFAATCFCCLYWCLPDTVTIAAVYSCG